MRVLSVAYPLAPVGPNATGGAEQILTSLDAALVRAGHHSIVVACDGSSTAGVLIGTPRLQGEITDTIRTRAWCSQRAAINQALEDFDVDIVHMHGLDFYAYMPSQNVPVLATLHLPPAWYPDHVFHPGPGRFVNCVSRIQETECPAAAVLLPYIENGVDVNRLTIDLRKRDFVVVLGRICPEKGFHLAMDAAKRAGWPLLLGGELFPYPAHIDYFEREIQPRLDRGCRFLGPLGLTRKRRVLTQARCLLVPSLVAETSSLVTMEAMACGTPVIAFRCGALPDLIDHGRTGFLVNNVEEMAAALSRITQLDSERCRQTARSRFSVERMARDYIRLYEQIIRERTTHAVA